MKALEEALESMKKEVKRGGTKDNDVNTLNLIYNIVPHSRLCKVEKNKKILGAYMTIPNLIIKDEWSCMEFSKLYSKTIGYDPLSMYIVISSVVEFTEIVHASTASLPLRVYLANIQGREVNSFTKALEGCNKSELKELKTDMLACEIALTRLMKAWKLINEPYAAWITERVFSHPESNVIIEDNSLNISNRRLSDSEKRLALFISRWFFEATIMSFKDPRERALVRNFCKFMKKYDKHGTGILIDYSSNMPPLYPEDVIFNIPYYFDPVERALIVLDCYSEVTKRGISHQKIPKILSELIPCASDKFFQNIQKRARKYTKEILLKPLILYRRSLSECSKMGGDWTSLASLYLVREEGGSLKIVVSPKVDAYSWFICYVVPMIIYGVLRGEVTCPLARAIQGCGEELGDCGNCYVNYNDFLGRSKTLSKLLLDIDPHPLIKHIILTDKQLTELRPLLGTKYEH